jgi:hypothetical protein
LFRGQKLGGIINTINQKIDTSKEEITEEELKEREGEYIKILNEMIIKINEKINEFPV